MPVQNNNHNFVLNLRVNEIVEVRTEEEILSTLGADGSLDELPFMPEMIKYCGKQFTVFKRADKTCDTIGKTGSRRMYNTVHLEELRCNGESHGGCQAGCLLFWKEAWLKRVKQKNEIALGASLRTPVKSAPEITPIGCCENDLIAATRHRTANVPDGDVFSCQATELLNATSPLPWWDVRQYLRDLASGNIGFREFSRVIVIAMFNFIQRHRSGRTYPFVPMLPNLSKTPTGILNLKAGELVQVKSKEEINATLDKRGKNRGLWFDVEMITYCGGQFKVLKRVEKIIDERTGKMLRLPNDCVVLSGVICRANLSRDRLFCPRSITPYWREIWLKRISAG